MLKYIIQGLLFGLAYVAPIGTQNLYVIHTALQNDKKETFKAALITVFFDISLALSCYYGIGILIEHFPIVKGILLLLGGILITYIGIGLLRTKTELDDSDFIKKKSLIRVIASCFAVTWLNPQAILDGSLLLGGFRASLPSDMSGAFILGVCLASFTWFHALAAFVTLVKTRLSNIILWINRLCGSILIFYGLKLGYSFLQFLLLK
jgi:L-lysine exporter family protein LysE/ArgO